MIVHVNHREPGQASRAGEVVAALLSLVESGHVDPRVLPGLRVHLDWVQYRANFREPVSVRRTAEAAGRPSSLAELAVDLRQVAGDRLVADLARAFTTLTAEPADADEAGGPVWLDEFAPLRDSIIWRFNTLFWQRLRDWEAATGRGFEAALPSGRSDANHAAAVSDSVGEFWTLLREMDKRGQLPAEVYALEIGVGTGARASLWLDHFQALDEARGTGYYPRLRFILGDYSMPALDRALATVQRHRDLVSMVPMDALNPLKTLAFLRYKIAYVHLTNVYDNLPVDEVVRRDGRLYLVEVRAYLARGVAEELAASAGLGIDRLRATVERLLVVGPDVLPAGGPAFWRRTWEALRLEERLVPVEGPADLPLPAGLDPAHLEDLLAEAPDDVRFHLSCGAAESFAHTLPLLHPRGYLHVQDIFVTAMDEYRQGFRGPGKLDGSVVNWVNGALLRAVAARAGYDVHFAPFHYRPGSRTSILYTTQRE